MLRRSSAGTRRASIEAKTELKDVVGALTQRVSADAERIITQRGRWWSDIALLYQRALAVASGLLRTAPPLLSVRALLRAFLQLPPLADVDAFAANNNATDSGAETVGDAARRALQRFYAPYAPHVRKLFTELATPGGGWERAPWLRGEA